MALFQTDFHSKSLSKVTGFNIVLPNDVFPEMTANNDCYKRGIKTLYLLHGYSGSNKEWLLGSSVQDMAVKYNIAIVMPSGDNSFYLDGKGRGTAYCQYVGKELIEYTRKTFGLSSKSTDTYIGGYSMGGFGAIHTALRFPNTYGKVMALSSALIINGIKNMKEDFEDPIADYNYYTSVFGNLDNLENSINNPEFLVHELKKTGQAIPPIYMACGTEDFLLEHNRAFNKFLLDEKINVHYEESPGTHDWNFWNRYLEPAIQWLLA